MGYIICPLDDRETSEIDQDHLKIIKLGVRRDACHLALITNQDRGL